MKRIALIASAVLLVSGGLVGCGTSDEAGTTAAATGTTTATSTATTTAATTAAATTEDASTTAVLGPDCSDEAIIGGLGGDAGTTIADKVCTGDYAAALLSERDGVLLRWNDAGTNGPGWEQLDRSTVCNAESPEVPEDIKEVGCTGNGNG